MRDLGPDDATGSAAGVGVALPSAAEILEIADRIRRCDSRGMTDAERVDFLAAGEVLKSVVEGAQADVTLAFDLSQRAEQARAGVAAERQGRGVAAQVRLARRASHHRGVRWVQLAKRLRAMPETFAALRAGRITGQGLATLRRLYTHPANGRLVTMESVARTFPGALAALIRLRDQRCRNRWCDAPIRDSDHPRSTAEGGVPSYLNGQGVCEACNIAKEAPGWAVRPRPGPAGLQDPHTVETTTPTGHVYTSVAPQVGIVRRPIAMEVYVAEDYGVAS